MDESDIAQKRSCFSLALASLARREHSAAELMQKLRKQGCEESDASEAILECQRLGYQSDARYADTYCRMRVGQGDGPLKIRQFLRAKGIQDSIIQARLAEEDWQAQLRDVWCRKYATPYSELSLKEKARQQRFLLNRGFPVDLINAFWKQAATVSL